MMVSPDCYYNCSEKFNRYFGALAFLCLALLVLTVLIMAGVPPTSRDALTHHLAVPKLWITHGGIVEMPDLVFSYYPMNLNILYAVPLLLGNDILPKYIHFLFALGTAWLIYSYLKARIDAAWALAGALLFLSIPVIVKLSINVYVDLGLVFFSWASIVYLCKWIRSFYSLSPLVIAAIFCGLGMGTKYNGMLVFILLILFIPMIYIRSSQKKPLLKNIAGYPMLFGIVAVTLFSPWMIKNYLLTGNPIYPLYNEHINPGVTVSSRINMSMKPWIQRKLIYKESASETALIPLRIFFQGKDDDPRFFDGKLNPVLLLFPLFLVFKKKKNIYADIKVEINFMAFFAIFFLLYASFMVDMRIRYIAPIIPPLVVLSILGIREMLLWIGQAGNKWIFRLGISGIAGVSLFLLSLNGIYLSELYQSVDPVPYLMGDITRDEYLEKRLPEYPAIQYANGIKDKKIKILALFLGKRLYYFNKPVVSGTLAFERMVSKTITKTMLTSQLQRQEFTHCIIGINRFENWVNNTFNADQKRLISGWLKNDCNLLHVDNGYAIFRLMPV